MMAKHPWSPGHINNIINSLDKLGEALPAGEVAMTDNQTARLIIVAAKVIAECGEYLDDGKPHPEMFRQRPDTSVTEATNSGP